MGWIRIHIINLTCLFILRTFNLEHQESPPEVLLHPWKICIRFTSEWAVRQAHRAGQQNENLVYLCSLTVNYFGLSFSVNQALPGGLWDIGDFSPTILKVLGWVWLSRAIIRDLGQTKHTWEKHFNSKHSLKQWNINKPRFCLDCIRDSLHLF